MQHTLLESERARNEAERIMVENRRQLAHATDQVRELIEKGRADAQAAADAIIQKAHAEAEAALHRAEREIQTAKDSALTEIFSKTADLAVTVAGRVLTKQLDATTHQQLVEAAIAELPSSSNGHGG
jgi:F-type H+-transporting ATPase subunit b